LESVVLQKPIAIENVNRKDLAAARTRLANLPSSICHSSLNEITWHDATATATNIARSER
jgi:hypothetical protein